MAPAEGKGSEWLRWLRDSQDALRRYEFDFFLSSLNPGAHWRLLDEVLDDALYLDIETTGLSQQLHYITVIGALYRGRMHQWVWPQPLDRLGELLAEARVVVTFNGSRFDLPFLRHHVPDLPIPNAHIDLLYLVRALGIKGGQKAAELEFGLARDGELNGFEGAAAVAAWCKARYGDRESFTRLLEYNAADVLMMRRMASVLYARHAAECGAASHETAGELSNARRGNRPSSFAALQRAWTKERPGIHLLRPKLQDRYGRDPVVVGIDLRAKPARPTGLAVCVGTAAETRIAYEDDEILDFTLRKAGPGLDRCSALLTARAHFRFGRQPLPQVWNCSRRGEDPLVSPHSGLPVLIKQMQGLTKRGIELTGRLRAEGIDVVESYPGACAGYPGHPTQGSRSGFAEPRPWAVRV